MRRNTWLKATLGYYDLEYKKHWEGRYNTSMTKLKKALLQTPSLQKKIPLFYTLNYQTLKKTYVYANQAFKIKIGIKKPFAIEPDVCS